METEIVGACMGFLMCEDERAYGGPPGTPIAWMAVVFFALAGCFLLNLWGKVDPIDGRPQTHARRVSKKTVRDPAQDPHIDKIGFAYHCNACHRNFSMTPDRARIGAEHVQIQLDHGDNDSCFYCHNIRNLETLFAHDGSEIDFADSEQLCRKCHGPKYRDWVHGVHGRPNGFWDPSRGASVKATCAACHDPHTPAFKRMKPEPGPKDGARDSHRGRHMKP